MICTLLMISDIEHRFLTYWPLYGFFGKVSVLSLDPFFNEIVQVYVTEYEFFIFWVRHISFYCASKILPFLQVEGLWQPELSDNG